MAEKGVKEKYGSITPELRERLDKEIDVIARQVPRLHPHACRTHRVRARHDILTAVRAAAAVAGELAIGLEDTIHQIRLIFDRSSTRALQPRRDIDVDFMDNRAMSHRLRHQEVRRRPVPRSRPSTDARARRDPRRSRACSACLREADRVAKVIPFGSNLAEARRMVRGAPRHGDRAARAAALDLGEKVEGLVRSTGTHARVS